MARARLPKANADRLRTNLNSSQLEESHDNTKEYGGIIEKVVDEIIKESILDLDDLIYDIQDLLLNRDNISVDDLNYYIALLPTVIYFATDRAETVGIHADSSSVIRKQKFDDMYLLSSGKTVNDKTSETNKLVINETVIESAYKRAYKKIQSRIQVADMVLNSLKKVLQWNISELEATGNSHQGGSFNAKQSKRK